MAGLEARLEANDNILMDVAQTMVNRAADRLNDNAAALARVDKRIRDSINGRLRHHDGLLKQVYGTLAQNVANQIEGIQASVNVIAARPEIQHWLAANPPIPAWDGVVPQPPDEGVLRGPDTQRADPLYNRNGLTVFLVFVNRQRGEIVAVPVQDQPDAAAMAREGWFPCAGHETIVAADTLSVQNILRGIVPHIHPDIVERIA